MRHGFIISLPRSGSTLLQRLMKFNFKTIIPAEPWILLPVILARFEDSSRSVFGGKICAEALEGFFGSNGHSYDSAIRAFYTESLRVYLNTEADAVFYDKTPRYNLIGEELVRIFPSAEYLILWRRPVDVMLSMARTWQKNRPGLHRYLIDLIEGASGVANVSKLLGDKCVIINYDDLCEQPIFELSKIEKFNSLSRRNQKLVDKLGSKIEGLGDPIGQKIYGSSVVNSDSALRIKKEIPYVLYLQIRKYLKAIPDEYYEIGKMDKSADFQYLESFSISYNKVGRDWGFRTFCSLESKLQLRCAFGNYKKFKKRLLF